MSQRELHRLEVIHKLQDKRLKQKDAANQLGLSVRQLRRLLRRVEDAGAPGLISKKRGHPSNNKMSQAKKDYALSLIKQHYADFGPTLAAEKLREVHGIKLSVETLRALMIDADLWIPRHKKLKRAYQPRYRRDRFGELIQIDGSLHEWFEDRGPKCTLLVFVDDATSILTSLYFAPRESTHTYFLATQQHLEAYGKPTAFYSDKLGVFRVNTPSTQERMMTQFGRSLHELNIDLICANTCQAKGRVERANKTLQDRLVKELRLQGISTINEANAYVPTFIKDYNTRFGKLPPLPGNAHRPLASHERLRESLCFKQERTVSYNLTVQHDRIKYLIEDTPANKCLARKRIWLHEYPDGAIELFASGRALKFRKLFDRVGPALQGQVVSQDRLSEIMEYIQNDQEKRVMSRSQASLKKHHLEHLPRQL